LESVDGVARRNRGGPEFPPESCGGAAIVAESPGVISAFGEPSSEPETALRIRGRALSPPLEEPLEELLDELLDEPLAVMSDPDSARRSLGRSGSLSLDERLDELLVLSAELDAARRNVG
jgi:hypothetical protein